MTLLYQIILYTQKVKNNFTSAYHIGLISILVSLILNADFLITQEKFLIWKWKNLDHSFKDYLDLNDPDGLWLGGQKGRYPA